MKPAERRQTNIEQLFKILFHCRWLKPTAMNKDNSNKDNSNKDNSNKDNSIKTTAIKTTAIKTTAMKPMAIKYYCFDNAILISDS